MPPPCCGAAAAGAAAAGAAAAGAAAGAACCGGGGVEAVFCCVGCCALVGGGVALLDENNGSMTDTRRTLTIAPFQTGKSMIQDNLCKNNFDALLTLCSPVATEPNAQEPIERGAILPLVVAPAFLLLLSSPCQSVTYRVQHTRTENLFLPYSTVCTLLSSSEDAAEVAKVRASRGLNICTCNSPCGRSRTVENYPPIETNQNFAGVVHFLIRYYNIWARFRLSQNLLPHTFIRCALSLDPKSIFLSKLCPEFAAISANNF